MVLLSESTHDSSQSWMDDNLNLERVASSVHWFCSINLRVEWNRERGAWHLRILKQKQVLFFNFVFGCSFERAGYWGGLVPLGQESQDAEWQQDRAGPGAFLTPRPAHGYQEEELRALAKCFFLLLLKISKKIFETHSLDLVLILWAFLFVVHYLFPFGNLTVCFTVSKRKKKKGFTFADIMNRIKADSRPAGSFSGCKSGKGVLVYTLLTPKCECKLPVCRSCAWGRAVQVSRTQASLGTTASRNRNTSILDSVLPTVPQLSDLRQAQMSVFLSEQKTPILYILRSPEDSILISYTHSGPYIERKHSFLKTLPNIIHES